MGQGYFAENFIQSFDPLFYVRKELTEKQWYFSYVIWK
jgi:hypothetical protein